MPIRAVGVVMLLVGAMAMSPAERAQAKKHVRSEVFLVAPQSLDDLVAHAAVIVDGDVTKVRPVMKKAAPAADDVFTEVTITVRSTLKGNVNAGDTLTCLHRAGRVETDDEIVEVVNEPTLAKPGRYVLFLNWNAALQSYVVVSSEGIYHVANGLLEPLGRSTVARAQEAREAATFVRDVHDRAVRGASKQ